MEVALFLISVLCLGAGLAAYFLYRRIDALQLAAFEASRGQDSAMYELKNAQARATQLEVEVGQARSECASANQLAKTLNIKIDELHQQFKKETEAFHKEINDAKVECSRLTAIAQANEEQIAKAREDYNRLTAQHEKQLADQKAQHEKQIASEQERFREMGEDLRVKFQNIASEIVQGQGEVFKKKTEEDLGQILNPFKTKLDELNREVKETRENEMKGRTEISTHFKHFNETTLTLQEEARNLANALKGNTKAQGTWGETILETLLQNSGMMKGEHYTTQFSTRDDEGQTFRPDVVFHMPDRRDLVIDSKVSLTDYIDYCNAPTPEAQNVALNKHTLSLKRHIDGLSGKNYSHLEGIKGQIDFVIMFVPLDAALQVVLSREDKLWEEAFKKRIILMGPSGLLPCIKLVQDLWRQDKLSKNAQKIVDLAGSLHDKLAGFVQTFEGVKKHIDTAADKAEDAYKQLASGKGNALSVGRQLKAAGLKTKKTIAGSDLYDDFEEVAEDQGIEADESNDTSSLLEDKSLPLNTLAN